MSFRNRPVGFLIVFDRLGEDRAFNEEDERLLQAFAASAATAVATAQNASEEALRRSIEASESERTRWARELHDETLQQLAGLRVLLSGARRSGDAERMRGAIDGALEQITTAIGDLRSLITELRPAALDELGTKPALESLVARFALRPTSRSSSTIDLAYENGEPSSATPPRSKPTMYRLVQEALTNVTKHAGAGARAGQRGRQRRADRARGPRRRPRLRPDRSTSAGSGCSACASGSRWSTGRSRSSPRRAGHDAARGIPVRRRVRRDRPRRRSLASAHASAPSTAPGAPRAR